MAPRKRDLPPAAPAAQKSHAVRDGLLSAVAFVVLAFLIYGPALTAGFIWDDGIAIIDNANLRSLAGLWNIWLGRGDVDYLPLKSSILWLVYQFAGPATAPYHILNVALHAANATLLWRVLRRLEIPGAWLAALIFLVHPTHVESVAWVSECKNTLSTMFGLLALLSWFAFERTRRRGHHVAAWSFFLCGLLCKPHLVILPVVLALCWWWRPTRGRVSQLLRHLVPFLLVALALSAVTVWFQNTRAIGAFKLPIGGGASRIANAGKATWWYLGKAISPVHPWYEMPSRPIEDRTEALAVLAGTRAPNPAPAWPRGKLTLWPLSAIYRQWRVTPPVWYDFIPAVAMTALFVWVASKRKGRARGIFFALSYFLVALVPVLGLVKMSYMRASWVADHFQYLADIGIIALASAGGTLLWRRGSRRSRRALVGVAAMVVAGFAAASFARAADFRDNFTLWTDTVAKNPHAAPAQVQLGADLLDRKDYAGAEVHLAEGLRLGAEDPAEVHNALGMALVSQGKVAQGIENFRQSLRFNDRQFFAHANLGDALLSEKQFADAAAEFRAAIRWNPKVAAVHFRLGLALLQSGEFDEAIASFEKADTLMPDTPEVTTALTTLKRRRALRDPR